MQEFSETNNALCALDETRSSDDEGSNKRLGGFGAWFACC
jgi:hypothetical protein